MKFLKRQFINIKFYKSIILFMTKHTLSNKSRYSIKKLSGFRARMSTAQGVKTLKNRRRKGRKLLTIKQ